VGLIADDGRTATLSPTPTPYFGNTGPIGPMRSNTLYTCRVQVDPLVRRGRYFLDCRGAMAAEPKGIPIQRTICDRGKVIVQ